MPVNLASAALPRGHYLEQISHLITDEDLSAEMLMQLRHNRVNVTICGENTIRPHTVTNGSEKYTIGFANQVSPYLCTRRASRTGKSRRDTSRHRSVIADNKLSGEVKLLRVADHLINRKVDIAIEYQIDYRSGNQIIDKFQRANIRDRCRYSGWSATFSASTIIARVTWRVKHWVNGL